jgi:uncharacterized protein (TIGR03067 family)
MSDVETLQGSWRTVSVEVDGSFVHHHLFENATLLIAGTRFTLRNPIPDADLTTEGSFQIDAAKRPKELVLTLDDGRTIQETYELDQDRLKVSFPTGARKRAVVIYERERLS